MIDYRIVTEIKAFYISLLRSIYVTYMKVYTNLLISLFHFISLFNLDLGNWDTIYYMFLDSNSPRV